MIPFIKSSKTGKNNLRVSFWVGRGLSKMGRGYQRISGVLVIF
jgi:hypothetical protein